MFEVTGENAELQFDVKEGAEGASFTVSGKISDEESDSVEGSIVSVGTGAAFHQRTVVQSQMLAEILY